MAGRQTSAAVSPHLPRVAHGPADVGRGAARGDPDDGVAARHPGGLEVARARAGVVLGPFDRLEERLASPRHQGDDERRVRSEGGGDLRGVEGAQPPARPGPDVEPASPRLEPRRDRVGGAGDRGNRRGHALGNVTVRFGKAAKKRERFAHRGVPVLASARRTAPISGG